MPASSLDDAPFDQASGADTSGLGVKSMDLYELSILGMLLAGSNVVRMLVEAYLEERERRPRAH